MHQFYFPDLSASQLLLDEDESKHAVRVLRLQVGDVVELVDGCGTRAKARVSDNHPKRCLLAIEHRETITTGRNFRLHLAVAPTKNSDRIEWLVEKVVENGIDAITLLHCAHSERTTVRLDRLAKVAVAAMKQSQQAWLPEITGPVGFADFLQQLPAGAQLAIAHCDDRSERRLLKNVLQPGGEVVLLIGPEGDFSPDEVTLALQNGCVPVSLGPTRLRTETAALTACLTVHFVNH